MDFQEQEATPEEEGLMQEAIQEAGRLMYESDSASAALVETVTSAGNPGEGVGTASAQIVVAVDAKMDLPEDFLLPLLQAVLPLVAEVAEAAGVEGADDSAEAALTVAVRDLANEYGLEEDQVQSLMADFGPEEIEQHGTKLANSMQGVVSGPQIT